MYEILWTLKIAGNSLRIIFVQTKIEIIIIVQTLREEDDFVILNYHNLDIFLRIVFKMLFTESFENDYKITNGNHEVSMYFYPTLVLEAVLNNSFATNMELTKNEAILLYCHFKQLLRKFPMYYYLNRVERSDSNYSYVSSYLRDMILWFNK